MYAAYPLFALIANHRDCIHIRLHMLVSKWRSRIPDEFFSSDCHVYVFLSFDENKAFSFSVLEESSDATEQSFSYSVLKLR